MTPLSEQSAFPRPSGPYGDQKREGMTYRQWLAGLALQGLIASNLAVSHDKIDQLGLSIRAVGYADALIAKLEEK